jgi:hypothetical protein
MYGLSPKAHRMQREAYGRRRASEAFADGGPHLSDDGQTVVVPSPARHERFGRVLRAYGFQFEYYDTGARWTRPTARPYRGRRYSPDGWLAWARQHYAKAWPNWQSDESL